MRTMKEYVATKRSTLAEVVTAEKRVAVDRKTLDFDRPKRPGLGRSGLTRRQVVCLEQRKRAFRAQVFSDKGSKEAVRR